MKKIQDLFSYIWEWRDGFIGVPVAIGIIGVVAEGTPEWLAAMIFVGALVALDKSHSRIRDELNAERAKYNKHCTDDYAARLALKAKCQKLEQGLTAGEVVKLLDA